MPSYKRYELKPKKKVDGGHYAPEKRWLVKGYLGLNQKTGLPKYTTLRGFERKSEAKEAFLEAVQAFKQSDGEDVPRMRLNDVYEQWWPMYTDSVSPSTAYTNSIYIKNHVLPDLGNSFIDQITVLDLQKWINGVAREQRTWRKMASMVKKMLDFAVRMQWLTANPMQYVTPPHNVKASDRVQDNSYSLDEAKRFKHAIDSDASKHPSHKIRQVYLQVVLATGVRAGEGLALKWSDIDWNNSTLHVQRTTRQGLDIDERIGTTKTEQGNRHLALNDYTISLLKSWRSMQGNVVKLDGWIFPGRAHNGAVPITNATAEYWLKTLQEKYRLRRITLHGLRHTKATLLAEDGISINDVAAILGHTDSSFTLRTYIHATERGKRIAEERYAELLESGSASGSKDSEHTEKH